jgi:hypothetical protein
MWNKHEPFARVQTRLLKHVDSEFLGSQYDQSQTTRW